MSADVQNLQSIRGLAHDLQHRAAFIRFLIGSVFLASQLRRKVKICVLLIVQFNDLPPNVYNACRLLETLADNNLYSWMITTSLPESVLNRPKAFRMHLPLH